MSQQQGARGSPARVAMVYGLFALAWICFSDRLLLAFTPDSHVLSALGTLKGLLFVLVTSALLYLSARRAAANPQAAGQAVPGMPSFAWAFAMAAALILLAGLLGVAHTASRVREEQVDQLRAIASLKADIAADWVQAQGTAGSQLAESAPTLLRRIHLLPEGSDSRVLLFRAEGTQLAVMGRDGHLQLVPEGHRVPGDDPAHDLGAPLRARAGHVMEGADERGRQVLGFVMPVPHSPWRVAALMDRDTLMAEVWHDAAWVVVVDGLALLLAAVISYLAWQRRELDAAVHQAAAQEDTLRALRLLDAIANGTTDAIYAADLQGRQLFVNSEGARLLGHNPFARLPANDVAAGGRVLHRANRRWTRRPARAASRTPWARCATKPAQSSAPSASAATSRSASRARTSGANGPPRSRARATAW